MAANFIYNNVTLPDGKTDLVPLPSGSNPANYVQDAEWNLVMQSMQDIKTAYTDWKVTNIKAYGAICDGVTDDYAAVQAAVTAAGVNNTVLFIPGPTKIGTNLTFPTNITLLFHFIGQLQPTNGVTLTINGPIEAKNYRVFGGLGTVTLGYKQDLDVKWWGAAGDGSTNDATVIQTVLNQAVALGGGTVNFPPGTYVINSRVRLLNGVKVTLRSSGAVLNSNVGLSTACLLLDTCTECVVEGFKFTGACQYGIEVYNSSFCTIRNNEVTGATALGGSAGIFIVGGSDIDIVDNYCHGNGAGSAYQTWDIATDYNQTAHERLLLRGNRCVSTGVTINMALFNVAHSRVAENHIANALMCDANVNDLINGYGIMLYQEPGGVGGGNVVTSNVVKDTQGTGIYMQTQPASTVSNNYLENVCTVLASSSLLIGAIAFNGSSTDVQGSVVGNVIKGFGHAAPTVWSNLTAYNTGDYVTDGGSIWRCLQGHTNHEPPNATYWLPSDGVQAGIVVEAPNVSVSGNSIANGTSGCGIYLNGSPNYSSIMGNTIKATKHGILSDGLAITGVTIANNSIFSTNDVSYGINLPAAATDCVVAANTVFNAGGAGISLSGASRCAIVSNIVRNPSQSGAGGYPGIELVNGTSCGVRSNISTGASANYNILENGTANEVCDNFCLGGSVGLLSSTGTNSTKDGNRFDATSARVFCVNVREFGAKGDGTTDDTAAIQAALNSVANGGTVMIPVGRYKITSSLTAPRYSGNSGNIGTITLMGEGNAGMDDIAGSYNFGSTLWAGNIAADTPVLSFLTTRGVQVRNLNIVGTAKATANSVAVWLRTADSNTDFNHVTIYGFDEAIRLDTSGATFNNDDATHFTSGVIGNCTYGVKNYSTESFGLWITDSILTPDVVYKTIGDVGGATMTALKLFRCEIAPATALVQHSSSASHNSRDVITVESCIIEPPAGAFQLFTTNSLAANNGLGFIFKNNTFNGSSHAGLFDVNYRWLRYYGRGPFVFEGNRIIGLPRCPIEIDASAIGIISPAISIENNYWQYKPVMRRGTSGAAPEMRWPGSNWWDFSPKQKIGDSDVLEYETPTSDLVVGERSFSRSGLVNGRTYQPGDMYTVPLSLPNATITRGFVTAAGTYGTITGVTANCTNGQTQVTISAGSVSERAKIQAGRSIDINNFAVPRHEVEDVVGDTVYLRTSYGGTTTNNLPVNFYNPAAVHRHYFYAAIPDNADGANGDFAENRSPAEFGTNTKGLATIGWFREGGTWKEARVLTGTAGALVSSINVMDKGADPTGINDSSAAFQSAINTAISTGILKVYIPSGTYKINTSLNLQGANGLTIEGAGAGFWSPSRINANCTARALFDCVGGNMIRFSHFAIWGDGTNVPAAAFLLSRPVSNASAGTHTFDEVWTNGDYSKAAIISISSESNVYNRCVLWNGKANGHGYWASKDNDSGIVSDYNAVPAVQSGGNTNHMFIGSAAITDGGGTSSAIKLGPGVANFNMSGCYTKSTGYAALQLDGGLANASITGWRDESTSTYCVYLAANKSLTDAAFVGNYMANSFYGANGADFTRVTIMSAGQHFGIPNPPGSFGLNVDKLYYSHIQVADQNIQVRTQSRGNFVQTTTVGGATADMSADATGNIVMNETGIVTPVYVVGASSPTFVVKDTTHATGGGIRIAGGSGELMQIGAGGPMGGNTTNVQIGPDVANGGPMMELNLVTGRVKIDTGNKFQLGTNSGAPGSPVAGDMYYDSGNNHFYGYNGSAWVQLDN